MANLKKNINFYEIINRLHSELIAIKTNHRTIKTNGYFNNEKVIELINMIDAAIDNSYFLESVATNTNDLLNISLIINELETEKNALNNDIKGQQNEK